MRGRGQLRGWTATPRDLIRAMPAKGDHPAGGFFFCPGCRSSRVGETVVFRRRRCRLRPLGGQRRQFSKIAVFVDLPHHPGGVAEPEHRAAGVPVDAGRELAEAGDLVARHHRTDRLAEPERVALFHIADVPMEPGVMGSGDYPAEE